MSLCKRILITGSLGFIGRTLTGALRASGAEVWGLNRAQGPSHHYLQANLLDVDQTCAVLGSAPEFDTVIHLAALAHGQKPPVPWTTLSANTAMTKSLLAGLGQRQPHFVLFSSVAVYGEDRREGCVDLKADMRPATDYGLSKKVCEELLFASLLTSVDVLRLAPVFDETHLGDVKKRVFALRLPIRVRILPPPQYSLCHLDTAVSKVLSIVRRGPQGRNHLHVADPEPYSQRHIADWFQGPSMPLPAALFQPFYLLARIVPGRRAYQLRCLYWKLFCSNVYSTELEN
jgi:nucleoside-diphosphate-sugar epimerase